MAVRITTTNTKRPPGTRGAREARARAPYEPRELAARRLRTRVGASKWNPFSREYKAAAEIPRRSAHAFESLLNTAPTDRRNQYTYDDLREADHPHRQDFHHNYHYTRAFSRTSLRRKYEAQIDTSASTSHQHGVQPANLEPALRTSPSRSHKPTGQRMPGTPSASQPTPRSTHESHGHATITHSSGASDTLRKPNGLPTWSCISRT